MTKTEPPIPIPLNELLREIQGVLLALRKQSPGKTPYYDGLLLRINSVICQYPTLESVPHDICQAWHRIAEAMDVYSATPVYQFPFSADNIELGYLARNCVPDVKRVEVFFAQQQPTPDRDCLVEKLERLYFAVDAGIDSQSVADNNMAIVKAIAIVRQHAAAQPVVKEFLTTAGSSCARPQIDKPEQDQVCEISDINEAAFQYAYDEWKRPKSRIRSQAGALQTFLKRYLYATRHEPLMSGSSCAPTQNDNVPQNQQREISAVSETDLFNIISMGLMTAIEDNAPGIEMAEWVIKVLRPCLVTTKPVSVSLEKCTHAIEALRRNVEKRTCRTFAKAVLDEAIKQGTRFDYVD